MAFYKLNKTIKVDELRTADGLYTNRVGAWLGKVHYVQDETVVIPFSDEGGGYILAPDDWYEYAEPLPEILPPWPASAA